MRVIDFLPHVLAALRDRTMTQTELTEAVWGSSGRNSSALVLLLDNMVRRGLLTMGKRGRAKLYTRGANIPQAILDEVAKVQPEMDEMTALVAKTDLEAAIYCAANPIGGVA